MRSELLAPGGSFASAVRAFEHGADAVYLGLSEFSARKGAVNFTLDHLRRLRTAFPDRSLYLALNTLVADKAMRRAGELLLEAVDSGIDALIVQDPGVARMAQALAPGLPLHGSTQMAVYDGGGAAELLDAGFSRVVLARECSLEEIAEIRQTVPDLELEVFIHGALCYGFSGLCQASQAILGRSANRGGCGQVCRTWFEDGERRLYPFSQNDLALGERIGDLVDLGIASLKIEGRMKGPEYTGAVCARYRALLDGTGKGGSSEAVSRELAERAALRFSRDQTTGWLDGSRVRDLLNPAYPGPTGIPAGRILDSDKGGALLKAETPLEPRDGLMWFSDGNPPRPVKQGLRFRDRNRRRLAAGERAWIAADNPPAAGQDVRLLSRSSDRDRQVNPSSWKPWKTPVALSIEVRKGSFGLTGVRDEFSWNLDVSIETEPARNPGRFIASVERAFSASGESDYCCAPVVTRLSEAVGEPFVPPAALKDLRRRFLEEFEEAHRQWRSSRLEDFLDTSPSGSGAPELSRQDIISDSWRPLPFPQRISDILPGDLSVMDAVRYLPLPPVELKGYRELAGPDIGNEQVRDFDPADFLAELLETDPLPLCIGLCNLSHVQLARRLAVRRSRDVRDGRLSFFLDYGLYTVNRYAWNWYMERIPGLAFFVEGLESEADRWTGRDEGLPSVPLGEGFPMPLFISRTCPVRHGGLGGSEPGHCPAHCRGIRNHTLQQNRKDYTVAIRRCVAYVLSAAL